MEIEKDGMYLKKGPWTAEEDEILINYVNKFGPRDWSSLRSKQLLPRTGKSCRLRWVNKLRPNLKTGCKFTAEEERVVIELQAQFGNKWAKIATYLPGRTDNDVKNFWSTRRKKLERILQTPSQKSPKNKQSIPEPQELHELTALEIPNCSFSQLEDQTSTWKDHDSQNAFLLENSETHNMESLPDMVQSNILNMEIPVFSDCQEPVPNPIHSNFQDFFEAGESSGPKSCLQIMSSSMPIEQEINPDTGLEGKNESQFYATPDDFFDDFSTDLFDFFDQPPTPLNREFDHDKAL